MKKLISLILLLGLFGLSACTKAGNPSMAPALYYCHTLEFPDTIYEYLKERIKTDSTWFKYHDKAILIEFELDNAVVVSAQEVVYEFDSKGNLRNRKKYQSNDISKLFIGMNVKPFNFTDGNYNGHFDSLIDGNRLSDK